MRLAFGLDQIPQLGLQAPEGAAGRPVRPLIALDRDRRGRGGGLRSCPRRCSAAAPAATRSRRLPERGPARATGNPVEVGGRQVGKVTAIQPRPNGHARVKMKIDGRLLAAARGHARRPSARPRCRGSPTATSRSSSGPNNAQTRSTTAARSGHGRHQRAGRPRPLFNTLDPQDARAACSSSSAARATSTTARASWPPRALKYLAPAALHHLAGDGRAGARPGRSSTRFVNDTSATVTTIASRRDDLSALVANTNATTRAIGDENRSLSPGAGRAAGHAAERQHDLRRTCARRSTTSTCW